MKRILINATQQEELRVAIVDGQKLYNLDIEVPSREQKKSSIFKGKVTRVEPSLEACFVEYGAERHGFLPFKEIARQYWTEEARKADSRPSIKDAIKPDQELIVQVEKEERGNKGAALTTKVSLAGRYSVLMPTEARAGGVSRRIEGEDRAQVREAFSKVKKPENMGAIVRTAGVGRTTEELQWDLDYLVTLWEAIDKAAAEKPAPFLIYHDSSVIIRALRDHYDRDIAQIIIDNPEIYQQAEDFVRQVMPHNLRKLKLYQDPTPLFSRFQIESQIESAFQREVRLPSGGAIVIDPTEALTSIDINSGRATKGADIEETALQTNLEAASEIARQLRLRDLGGLFVIDFIDMMSTKNQREVENRLRQELKMDRARVRTGRISRFGLLELSRQRLRPSLGESSQEVCRLCQGQGTVRSAESLSLAILRLIGEEAAKEHTGSVIAHLPVDVATFLLNEKRADIARIETNQKVKVVLVPDHNYERPHYSLERLRKSEKDHPAVTRTSYDLIETREPDIDLLLRQDRPEPLSQQAAVQSVKVDSAPPPQAQPQPAQPARPVEQPGLFVRMWKSLFGTGTVAEPVPEPEPQPTGGTSRKRGGQQQRSQKRRGGRASGQNRRNGGRQGGRPAQKRDGNRATANRSAENKSDEQSRHAQESGNDSASGNNGAQGKSSGARKTNTRSRRRSNRRRGARGGRGQQNEARVGGNDTASQEKGQASAQSGKGKTSAGEMTDNPGDNGKKASGKPGQSASSQPASAPDKAASEQHQSKPAAAKPAANQAAAEQSPAGKSSADKPAKDQSSASRSSADGGSAKTQGSSANRQDTPAPKPASDKAATPAASSDSEQKT